MEKCGKAVKVTIDGRVFYYQTFYDEAGKANVVKVYGSDGEYIREFWDLDSMSTWLREEVNRQQRKERVDMQESFMRRFEQLKGEKSDIEFAEALEMPYGTVYQYFVGRRFPSVSALKQIAEKCGVTIDWLVGKDDREE